MPQISLPDFKLKDIGDRIQDVRDDNHLPEEMMERLSDAGERVAEAGQKIGDEVGERISDLRWSDLRLPALNLPSVLRELSMPNVRAPKVDVPHVELPRNLPRNIRRELAKLDLPEVTIGKRKSSGPPLVPFVVLAAIAGVFVGWWLATSEFASTRIRAMIDQARVRMGMASDWDETVEERTEEFWGSERGWETAGEPDKDQPKREWSSTTESTAPSGSISGDRGSMDDDTAMTSATLAGAGATAGATSGWPGNPYGNPGGSTGGTWTEGSDDSAGGTGYEPDSNR